MTGATGSVYGLRLLELLRDEGGWETHLVMSQAAVLNIREEMLEGKSRLEALADVVHNVMLKERRRLVMMTRETPLNLAHLRNMTACTEMGAIVFPPVPAFYSRPASLADVIDHSCMRVLDQFGIHSKSEKRWRGLSREAGNLVPEAQQMEGE
jgi:4-hydroxy-3-polyprenylbenzoate decarboxylase